MWVVLAFVSALCLGGYDVSKKIALQQHRVVDVLTLSILISSLILSVPLLLSRCCPELLIDTPFYVPKLSKEAHMLTFVKSCIVLSNWIFAYVSLKHLPLSVVSPMQATRPMWTLVGALLIFGERLNSWQWVGIVLATGSIFAFSFRKHHHLNLRHNVRAQLTDNRYYICLVLAILIGSGSGLYDKYMMRHFDHNFVQVYYTFYQAILMMIVWWIEAKSQKSKDESRESRVESLRAKGWLPIVLISVFLVMSDNVYMLALEDPDSLIAVVSTIRRGGAVIGFAYGLLILHESDAKKKAACMVGIMLGLICLALGSLY